MTKKVNLTDIILSVLGIALIIWFGLSFIEVITHNGITDIGYEFSKYNFFEILLKLCK